MKVFCNSIDIDFKFIEVEIDLSLLARTFKLVQIENSPSVKIGDKIRILDDFGVLLIEAPVEYMEGSSDKHWIYSGRNNGRFIIDNYVKKSVEINDVIDLADFFRTILKDYDIKVKGSFKLDKKTNQTVFVGQNLSSIIADKTMKHGIMITNDAEGNLEIYEVPTKVESKTFSSGENIIASNYFENESSLYNECTIFSQGSLSLDKNPEIEIKGSAGGGGKVVVLVNRGLTENECNNVAKMTIEKSKINSFVYRMDIEGTEKIELNKMYKVKDDVLGIEETLRVTGCDYVMSDIENVIKVSMVRV